MSGTDVPKISDETVEAFIRGSMLALCPHLSDEGLDGYVARCKAMGVWERERAGLAAALVASGYRREADVRAEIAATFRSAAAGRREYADGMPRGAAWEPSVELLNMQATTLESAALVAEGNLEPLYNWLPSRRWTDEMMANLYRDGATALEQAQPLLAAGSEPLVCGCGIPPDGAPGASGCSSSCMLPVPVAAGSEVESLEPVESPVIDMGFLSLPAELQAEAERAASEGQERSDGVKWCDDEYAGDSHGVTHSCGLPNGHAGSHLCRCTGLESYTWPAEASRG